MTATLTLPDLDTCGLTCEVADDWQNLADRRDAWDDFVASAGGDVYFTFDWCRIWWRHYGGGRRLRVLTFRRQDRIVALLPLAIERLWLGPVPMRIARLVGADSTTVVLSPPVLPEHAQAVYRAALAYLLVEQRCDALWLGPLAGHRPHREQIRQACRDSESIARLALDHEMGVHTVFDLPATYDDYLAGLDKSQRGNVRRDRRNFEKLGRVELDIVRDPARIDAVFTEFADLHQAQWQAQGMLGHFGDWPHGLAFNRDLARALAEQARAWILRLSVDGQCVSCEYGFVFDNWLYWRLPGRRTGEPWEKLGLGRVSLAHLIEQAIGAGVAHIEAGAGRYDYKRRMGAREHPVSSLLITANRPAAVAKACLLRRASQWLHLLYYRIWFSRIAARLPLPRRPLWRIWIRSRV